MTRARLTGGGKREVTRRLPRPRFGLLALLAAASPGSAQEGRLSLDVGVSYSVPPAGSSVSAATYTNLGARAQATFGDAGFLYGAGVGGLSLEAGGASWVSGVAGGGFRLPVSRLLSLGISGATEAFTVGSPLSYRAWTGQIEPEIIVSDGTTSLRLRGYGALGVSDVEALESLFRFTRFGLVRIDAGTTVTTDLEAIGGAAELARWFGPVQTRLAVEAYGAPQGEYFGGRAGLWVVLAAVSWNLEFALWDTPTGHETVVTAALEIPFGGGFSSWIGGGRYGPDPLLDAPAAGGASALVSWQAARFGREVSPLRVTLRGDSARVRLELDRPDADHVDLVGDFTDWKPVPMWRDGKIWRVELIVPAGVHHFVFRVDGEWFVPEDAPGRTTDEWGMPQATLLVPGN